MIGNDYSSVLVCYYFYFVVILFYFLYYYFTTTTYYYLFLELVLTATAVGESCVGYKRLSRMDCCTL